MRIKTESFWIIQKLDIPINKKFKKIQINIGGMAISNSKYEKLLGTHIDNKLTFEPYVRSLCKKASQKLNAFARIAFSWKFDQRKILLNAFITSHFSYALVVWIFQQPYKSYSWKSLTYSIPRP